MSASINPTNSINTFLKTDFLLPVTYVGYIDENDHEKELKLGKNDINELMCFKKGAFFSIANKKIFSKNDYF